MFDRAELMHGQLRRCGYIEPTLGEVRKLRQRTAKLESTRGSGACKRILREGHKALGGELQGSA